MDAKSLEQKTIPNLYVAIESSVVLLWIVLINWNKWMLSYYAFKTSSQLPYHDYAAWYDK